MDVTLLPACPSRGSPPVASDHVRTALSELPGVRAQFWEVALTARASRPRTAVASRLTGRQVSGSDVRLSRRSRPMPSDHMQTVQGDAMPKVNRMQLWRDRNLAAGLKGVMVWIPPEREAELRSLVQRWRLDAEKALASDLPSCDQLQALVRFSKASRRPLPADALASRTAAAAWLDEVAPACGADR